MPLNLPEEGYSWFKLCVKTLDKPWIPNFPCFAPITIAVSIALEGGFVLDSPVGRNRSCPLALDFGSLHLLSTCLPLSHVLSEQLPSEVDRGAGTFILTQGSSKGFCFSVDDVKEQAVKASSACTVRYFLKTVIKSRVFFFIIFFFFQLNRGILL